MAASASASTLLCFAKSVSISENTLHITAAYRCSGRDCGCGCGLRMKEESEADAYATCEVTGATKYNDHLEIDSMIGQKRVI